MRPNPLMPTLTAMCRTPSHRMLPHPEQTFGRCQPNESPRLARTRVSSRLRLLLVVIRRQHGRGVRHAELCRATVGHGQKSANPAGNGVLRQGRYVEGAELFQGGLLVLQTECSGREQVPRYVLAEDLECAAHAHPGGYGRVGRPAKVGVVEVGQPVRRCTYLAAYAALFPGQHRLMGSEAGEHGGDGVAVADDDAVDATDVTRLGDDPEAPGGTYERQRRLLTGAGHLHRH